MKTLKVTMVCKETWRAEVILEIPKRMPLEKVKILHGQTLIKYVLRIWNKITIPR